MRRNISLYGRALLLLGLVSLGALTLAAAESPPANLVGYLVRSEGKVELKRPSWKRFHPAEAGTRLERQDQLRLGPEGRAVVLCADFETTWRAIRGERSDVAHGCRRPKRSLSKLLDGLAIGTRDQEASEQIRSPRGAIRDPTPRIRWHSFGAQEYEVMVSLGTRTIWGPVVAVDTEQRIPPGFLEPERPYRVQVRRAGDLVFVEPSIPFHLIAEKARAAIAGRETKLLAIFQEESVDLHLARVFFLAHEHLWDEALTILDVILPNFESAAVELWGAHLALGLGFQKGALERYEKARKMARESGNLETEAAASAGLGRSAAKRDESQKWFKDALMLYQELDGRTEVQR